MKQRRYETVSTPALPLKVARSASAGATVSDPGNTLVVDRKGVKNLGEDIRFIRTKTGCLNPRDSWCIPPAGWLSLLLLLVAGAGCWLGFRKAAARRADVAGTRNRKATRMALKRLSTAREFLQKDLYTAFYEELHRSLVGFIGDKLAMDMAEQTQENIRAALLAGSVPEATATEFVGLLAACEEARYSPDAGHDAMNAHYDQAVKLITAIDASMKKTPVKGALRWHFCCWRAFLLPLRRKPPIRIPCGTPVSRPIRMATMTRPCRTGKTSALRD